MSAGASAGWAAAGLVIATCTAVRFASRTTRRRAVIRRLRSSVRPAAVPAGRGPAALATRIHELLPPPSWLPTALRDGGFDVSPATAWPAWVATATMAMAAGAMTGGPPMAVLAVALVTVAPLAILRARRGRGPARLEAALPNGLEAVARALRSGASLRQAIDEAARSTPGPLGEELRKVSAESTHGTPLVAALEGLAVRRPLPGFRLAVAALCLGAETGGAQAKAVDGVATTLRERLAVAAEARALASQARMSALVIGVAPVGFGVFAASTDPRTAEFLLRTPAGMALLVAGLALDGLGWLWMQRLCRVTA